MSQFSKASFESLNFYATAPYGCSYLPGQVSRSQVATPSHLVDSDAYSELAQKGFRRSGMLTYRPYCESCKACIAMRVDVNAFKASRSQRRALLKHFGLQVQVLDLAFSPEHYALFQRYQAHRHTGGGMDGDSVDQYTQFLLQSHVNSHMVEFREPNDTDASPGKLKILAVIDVLSTGLSSVYTFFEPDEHASYGTYSVLWQIQMASRLGLPHVYLGYWVKESQKMSYKTQFRPHELFIDGQWRTI